MNIGRLLQRYIRFFNPSGEGEVSRTRSLTFRRTDEPAAVVFLPGFTGDVLTSWDTLPEFLSLEQKVRSWNILGLNFASSKDFDFRGWNADPGLDVLAQFFRTEMSIEPFASMKSLAVVAHSMAGLVVQRAMLDDDRLAKRITHLTMFGTPSAGVAPFAMLATLKRQIADMEIGSPFIEKLRADWKDKFGNEPRFKLLVIAGDEDDFVGPESSLEPFSNRFRAVVPGNHSSLIRPDSAIHPAVQLLVQLLAQDSNGEDYKDSARLAVELRNFQDAADQLLPRYADLDDAALVTLAMALDGLNKGEEALRILDDVYQGGRKTTAEAYGMLAGRIKRRWLIERRNSDLVRSKALYQQGLREAEESHDHAQAYYHAINLGFLEVLSAPVTADIVTLASDWARKALAHCYLAPETNWRFATQGEAYLMVGDLENAAHNYRRAVLMTDSPRELGSISAQAIRLAWRVLGPLGAEQVKSWFQK